jgi:hypothetical protein
VIADYEEIALKNMEKVLPKLRILGEQRPKVAG